MEQYEQEFRDNDTFELMQSRSEAWMQIAKRLWKVTDKRRGETGVEVAINIIDDLEADNAALRARLARLEAAAKYVVVAWEPYAEKDAYAAIAELAAALQQDQP